MGHVLPAGCGQAPTRQAALAAGLPPAVACTGVNKVCASGLKAVMLGAATIQTGSNDVVVAGGFESMSRVPHLLGGRARAGGLRLGDGLLADGLLADGLTCPHSGGRHMGDLAEAVAGGASGFDGGLTPLSREEQDAFALASHARAASAAAAAARAGGEVVPVSVPATGKGGGETVVSEDEPPTRLDAARVPTLRPAFTDNGTGTITAANASPLSDGAAALVLASSSAAAALGCTVLGHICAYADAALSPVDFARAPAAAARRALAKAGLSPADVELWEVNEAFAAVPLLFAAELGVELEAINVHGGAVALGHPLGASGAAILVRLVHAMAARGAAVGVAAICNGGGGASAVVVRRSPRADEG
jgi:acetyl-CoA C-acetyltransferase